MSAPSTSLSRLVRPSLWWLLATICLVRAQSLAATNVSERLPFGQSPSLALGVLRDRMVSLADLVPLVDGGLRDLPHPDGLLGSVRLADVHSVGNLSNESIVYISCDRFKYSDDDEAFTVVSAAIRQNVNAVITFSTTSHFCSYTTSENDTSPFKYVYSTSNVGQARVMESLLLANSGVLPSSRIQLRSILDAMENATNGSTNGNNGGAPSFSANSTTAVAMIILYAITGVITLLFLVIIITGAIRAHRHPERYGPRVVNGRPRQSRAKGIARAMLDTIPIVKFGERQDDKVADVELASSSTNRPETEGREKQGEQVARDEGARSDPVPEDPDAVSVAPPAADNTPPPAEQDPENILGCPICTDDFEVGEDIRVLPCDHKFHPPCVDPWLLNVSGTCPLCRIDLRPARTNTTEGDTATAQDDELPSPDRPTLLAPPGDDQTPTNTTTAAGQLAPNPDNRRHSFLSALHLRRMRDAPPAERIAAIRRFRAEQEESASADPGDDSSADPRRSRRLSARLQDALGVRRKRGSGVSGISGSVPDGSGSGSDAVRDRPEGSGTTGERGPEASGAVSGAPTATAATSTAATATANST